HPRCRTAASSRARALKDPKHTARRDFLRAPRKPGRAARSRSRIGEREETRMRTLFPLLFPALTAFVSSLAPIQKVGLIKGDFEHDRVGELPSGWYIPKACTDAGYHLEVSAES